ncbi:hypothetical protein [Hypericibacter sp.]|uniref:hypothetical protein n=1 Tax=Hypericibacter sp. TaxID=2705401 RepID=UPI003D6D03E7
MKALPHAGMKHGETVCCAGITKHGEWRRQFPIHFRRLQQKFFRWDIIEYEFRAPKDDKRSESRRVQEDTIRVVGSVSTKERSSLLAPVIVSSTGAAAAKGQTLALIRPCNVAFAAKKKNAKEIENERAAYQEAAKQGSFFDAALAALEPCPYAFKFGYQDSDGGSHVSTCDDWETAAMFRRFSEQYGELKTLDLMKKTFEKEYPQKGMVFAMGTHSRYPDVWLLVGVLRVDETTQLPMAL